jgi:hypothetical protein
MSNISHLLSITFLSSALLLAAVEPANAQSKTVSLGLINAQTVAVTDSGGSQMKGGIVVRFTSTTNQVQSFGISNEAGILVTPLPVGRYCYDAFSSTGVRLQTKRQAADRCFVLKKGEDLTIGVEVRP